MVGHLVADDGLGELADDRQLIAEVAVETFEPLGQLNHGVAVGIGHDVTVIDIQHVWRFHSRVRKVFIGGVKRVVDLNGNRPTRENAVDADVALEKASPAVSTARGGEYSVAIGRVIPAEKHSPVPVDITAESTFGEHSTVAIGNARAQVAISAQAIKSPTSILSRTVGRGASVGRDSAVAICCRPNLQLRIGVRYAHTNLAILEDGNTWNKFRVQLQAEGVESRGSVGGDAFTTASATKAKPWG